MKIDRQKEIQEFYPDFNFLRIRERDIDTDGSIMEALGGNRIFNLTKTME